MSSLFVKLPLGALSGSSEFAYVVSPDGRSIAASGSARAALLPAATGAGAEVVAVVPAAALSWHRIDWPRGVAAGSSRLRAVLEGLLEDQLLDEPEALHFALAPQSRAGEPAWVAVCARAWLRSALQALEAAGRPVSRIVPEVAPEAPHAVYALGDPEHATLITRGPEGVWALPLSAHSVAMLPPLPEDVLFLAEPAVAAMAEPLLQRPLVLQPAPQRWLQAAQSRWDLAQFEFASSGRARQARKLLAAAAEVMRAPQWRPARWAAVALVAIHLVGLNAWAWRERAVLANKREAVRSTLTQTFPQVKVVVDAPVQMEREVAALRQATGAASPGDLETLLRALAQAAPERALTGIDYRAGELRARGLDWNEDDLATAEPALRSQGLAVELEDDIVILRADAPR